MMYQKGTFKLGYIEELGTQVLELPYAQKSLSMIILLPGDMADGSAGGLEQVRLWTMAKLAQKLVVWIKAGQESKFFKAAYLL